MQVKILVTCKFRVYPKSQEHKMKKLMIFAASFVFLSQSVANKEVKADPRRLDCVWICHYWQGGDFDYCVDFCAEQR